MVCNNLKSALLSDNQIVAIFMIIKNNIVNKMDREDIRDSIFHKSPHGNRTMLSKMMDKWSLLVLYKLDQQGVMRFNDLHRAIPGISQKLLTTTLKNLESNQLVDRKVIPAVPVKVEYKLTDQSIEILPLMDQLLSWAIEQHGSIRADS